ncbi:hypothetical protein [Nocardioides sp. SYSU D00038]|uniref:hypothetical protein n=1 Tax=Nocardioides sp. SYSU D00038 TaxID=2812554 RepID=UPI0019686DDE|nr:hypothetical protein [Nocardioides sp. SYSU D00038]
MFDVDDVVDAEGASIRSDPTGLGWELLVGMRVTEEGVLHRDSITIDYTVDDEAYSVTIPYQVTICTGPEFEVDGSCPVPGLDG